MFDKVAVVGDSDLVYAFRALGIKVFSPRSIEEAREVMKIVKKENFALCLMHESLLKHLKTEQEAFRLILCPAIVGFSDYREVTGRLDEIMREMAIKATGSDSLVKNRGEDERK